MKKLLGILYAVIGAVVALLTLNASTVIKQKKKIKKLEDDKKELEIEEEVLIRNAKDAKKKTIKSKEELKDAMEKLNNSERSNFNTSDEFLQYLRKSS